MRPFRLNSGRILPAVFSLLFLAFTGMLDARPGYAAGGGGGGGSDPIRVGCFYDLPQITANLQPVNGYPHFMSLHLSVCLENDEAALYLQRIEPRVLDSIQPYLRDVRLQDLHGAEGMYRLRHDLLARLRAVAWPIEIEQVVFREILVD